jgi:hypothetical protein
MITTWSRVRRPPSLRIAAAAWLILFVLGVGYVLGFRRGHQYAWDHAEYCDTPVSHLARTTHQPNSR